MRKKFAIILFIVLSVAVMLNAFTACATAESDLKQKYEDAGYLAQSFPYDLQSIGVDKNNVDFVYHAVKGANSVDFEQVSVITFNNIESSRAFYDANFENENMPNMIRWGKAVIFGTKQAVELY